MKDRVPQSLFSEGPSSQYGTSFIIEQAALPPPLQHALLLQALLRMSARITVLQRHKGPVRELQQIHYLQCLIIIARIH